MLQASIAALAVVILMFMSLRANRRFSRERRLPMQWSISGSVNWTAPRPVALAFTPILAGFILFVPIIATNTTAPRPGQEGFEVPVITILSVGFVATHALHLWLIDRMMKTNRS